MQICMVESLPSYTLLLYLVTLLPIDAATSISPCGYSLRVLQDVIF